MSTPRPPTPEDFRVFFSSRLQGLSPKSELVWMSNQVPVEALAAAYPQGIFPWPGDDPEFFPWVCPAIRGVLPLETFRLGKSTRRQLRRSAFRITFDQAFPEVIRHCHHAHEPESWIHPRMQDAYTEAHRRGFAHSVEVWDGQELVGGVYGVDSGNFFSGESMFHHASYAGKAAICALVERLQARGDLFLDIQQLTPHMRAMGAENWERDFFLQAISRLKKTSTGF